MSRKLVYVVSEDWYFITHRLSLAKCAIEKGYEIIAVTKINNHGKDLSDIGVEVIDINFSRSFKKPFLDLISLYKLIRVFQTHKPDIVHNVGIKLSLLSSLAGLFSKPKIIINAYTGLGYVFSSNSKLARAIRFLLIPLLRFLNFRNDTWTVFQNENDKSLFLKNNLIQTSRTEIIKGSGVNTDEFPYTKEPDEPTIVMLASRLLWDKGIGEFVKAARGLKTKHPDVKFVLVGDIDPQNPMTLKKGSLNAWVKEGIIEWWGHKQNMPKILGLSHIVTLPSYREGLPKVLLEAASIGRPIVTTNVPGCRDVVRDNINGFLVDAKESSELIEAIDKLIINKDLRLKMGLAGREIIFNELSSKKIDKKFLKLYRKSIQSIQI